MPVTTDLIAFRREILRGVLETQARFDDPANDHLPHIASMRARVAAGVANARRKLADAENGTYVP